ncbi:MAG TPA: baseplate J/gp47 family protein [Caulobacteraceae bacterium]|nr:baseplate J/gp47 family protein [Caulobacteraceae bacterium]
MSDFARPSRSDLINRIRDDLNARIAGADSRLRRSTLGGIAASQGGALDALYGYLDNIADQIFPGSQTQANLVRFASIWGISPNGPTAAAGPASSAPADAGATIAAASILQDGNGVQYTVTADAETVGGVMTVNVQAVVPGAAGNAIAGVILTLASPVDGVPSEFTVGEGGLTGGNDAESPASLLAQVLQRIQEPPQGGCADDYVAWATAVAGVTRAWVIPQYEGAVNGVGVVFVCDGRADIIPTGDDVAAVQAYLTDPSRKPVTALVTAIAPTPVPINPTIHLNPSNPATQAAVTAALNDLLSRVATPGATIEISQFRAAIADAPGVQDSVVTAPAADVAQTATQIATLGAITWS